MRLPRSGWGVWCALLTAVMGCGAEGGADPSLFACPECEVVVTEGVTLGALEDPAGPVGLTRVAVAAGGDLILTSDMAMGALPLAYSPSGEYRGEFGSRGEGPGEFGAVIRLASVVGGPLVLYDAQLGVHLFDSTGAFARRLKPGRGIPQPLREPAILGGEVLAVASYTRSTRAPDRPVELFGLEDGEFIGALGPPSALDPETGILDVPHLAAGCAGELWLHGAEPTFTRWNVRGEQTAAFQLDSAAVAAAASAVGIPPGLIATLRLHEDCDAGVRWLAIVLRDRAALTQADVAPGDPLPPALLSPSHIHRTHDTLILAVDASSDALLAGAALPRAINHFLADGRIAVDIEEASGHQYVQLYRLTLQR